VIWVDVGDIFAKDAIDNFFASFTLPKRAAAAKWLEYHICLSN